MADTRIDTEPAAGSRSRPIPDWAGPLLTLGALVIGQLPWLTTGLRLPLQNLWALPASAAQAAAGCSRPTPSR
jgi:hypothetical protein